MIKIILPVILSLFIITGCDDTGTKKAVQNTTLLCVPVTTDKEWYSEDKKAPLFDGLDVLHYPVTTDNNLAQKYFNQGLVLAYGFNHAEAARSFHYATKLDPECAMAYWGFAYVLGPNYNAGMEDDNYQRAWDAIQNAIKYSEKCTEKEKALIRALSKRYVEDSPDDRSHLDQAYMEAMREVFDTYSDDPDIGTLYVESIMDLHPWDLYEKDGTPKDWTPEIVGMLERVLALNPHHVGAHHFYIHAVEASGTPERGLPSAEIYDNDLVPGSGHLVHMPSHIYIRTGDYHRGTKSNIRAVEVDSNYVTACHAQGAYPLAYYPHNYHFMSATATLGGSSKWAIKAAHKVSDHAHREVMKEPGWGTLQHFYTIPYYVYVKFGRWDEVLEMKNEDPSLIYPEAVRHYARGMAFVGKQDITNARKELNLLEVAAKNEKLKKLTVWDINSMHTLMQIARRVLKGEILASEGDFELSIAVLKEAAAIEDDLNYDEPPDWFFSVRHHLGAVQVEAGEYEDAILTYQEDLERLPKNGWALHGIKLAYEKMDDRENALAVADQLENIWSAADTELSGSRVK